MDCLGDCLDVAGGGEGAGGRLLGCRVSGREGGSPTRGFGLGSHPPESSPATATSNTSMETRTGFMNLPADFSGCKHPGEGFSYVIPSLYWLFPASFLPEKQPQPQALTNNRATNVPDAKSSGQVKK